MFRIVTALAPPFVMESELDEDGLCLRGLHCHRVSPVGMYFAKKKSYFPDFASFRGISLQINIRI